MKIVHISDSHGAKYHSKLEIPDCDILIHSGDIGGRTDIMELTAFLIWFEQQPAKVKIFVPGNHDICLDLAFANSQGDSVMKLLARQKYYDAIQLIENYNIKYLVEKEYVYEGVKFWGSPYSPSFHRQYWAFNADRGQEIQKRWSKIPSDVNVLITHGPCYNILDKVEDKFREKAGEDLNVGDKDLLDVIKARLFKLQLHCCGHIHDNVGVVCKSISNTRHVLFSNGAVVTNEYKQLITKPLIIHI